MSLATIQIGCNFPPELNLDKDKTTVVYWIAAILQPSDKSTILTFLKSIQDHIWENISQDDITHSLNYLCKQQYLLKLSIGLTDYFSINPAKHIKLSINERLNKDRIRFFLLNCGKADKFQTVRRNCKIKVDGVPPSFEERLPIQLRVEIRGRRSQPIISSWVSLLESTLFTVSPSTTQLSPTHKSLSYPNYNFIDHIDADLSPHMTVRHILAADLGISVQLISRILANKTQYYRSFEIIRKNGNKRLIEAPRTYLKVLMRYINHHLLTGLAIHDSVHSYRQGKSFLTNAQIHVAKQYVFNLDIENYFGCINKRQVRELFSINDFTASAATLLSELCTFNDRLPQGAPTSPIISNAILFKIDQSMHRYCEKNNLCYTRYSDDITLSGNSRQSIVKAKSRLIAMIHGAGFKINDKKTRLMPYHKQQLVTGVVVNKEATPARNELRRIRAKFHQAACSSQLPYATRSQLLGYISYLSHFEKYRNSELLHKYSRIIENVSFVA
ncbi:retron St85 family RNA-directed DNA polymerase [Catenovulum agarivorans]|uniref:retron St85 family RNA-directed DNA polymerase n=1 Tax=Catenovulum agarivorans TaxID=1172192 RepID=UPI0012F9779B|nr:retron St85 family RNA-directed DNA polymerase [Catenovulum agarivorans]